MLLPFGNDHNRLELNFNGKTVESINEVKLLGVTVDKNLKFDIHVSQLCMKTNRQINALSRLKNIVNRCKMLMYKTYILSNFNSCSTIWHHCSKYATLKMEKLNKRALRIVYHNNKDMNYNNLPCISNN